MNLKYKCKKRSARLLALILFFPAVESNAADEFTRAQISEYSVVALMGGPWLDTFVCSGVLLSGKYVLTAAHCVCLREPSAVFYGLNVYSNLAPSKGPGKNGSWGWENTSSILSWNVHPETDCKRIQNGDFGVDLALIQIKDDWTYFNITTNVAKIEELQNVLKFDTNGPNNFVGISFGVTSENDQPGLRHLYDLELTDCNAKNSQEIGCTPDVDLVSLAANGVDTCLGDSGGPVYSWSEDNPILVSITSRGRKNGERLCGSGGVYTSMATELTLDWIKEAIGN